MNYKRDCAFCGTPLIYLDGSVDMECFLCKNRYQSNARCENGHFICDICHTSSAKEIIKKYTVSSNEKDPIEIALTLMKNKKIKMHGPEHHFLVPAALLCAYYNQIGDNKKKEKAINEAELRAKNVLGGFCGFYGACGAAIGVGIFLSIITTANPLSKTEWRLSNLATAQSLESIAIHGGPRCCKRNTLLAIKKAIAFVKDNLGIEIKTKSDVKCVFSSLNRECIKELCPFFRG